MRRISPIAISEFDEQTFNIPSEIEIQQALAFVSTQSEINVSALQSALLIGYNKSSAIIDKLEKDGVISPLQENGQRTIY